MLYFYVLIEILLFHACYDDVVFGQTYDDIKRLKSDLIEGQKYDKNLRPVINQNKSVEVNIDLKIDEFIGLEEDKGELVTIVSLNVSWRDELLKWNPPIYNNTRYMVLQKDDIWKPDIFQQNTMGETEDFGSGTNLVKVDSSGIVVWEFSQILQSYCFIDFFGFPYDEQTCYINISSRHAYEDIRFVSGSHPNGYNKKFGTWKIISVVSDITNSIHRSTYLLKIELDRITLTYVFSIILPIVFLVGLNMLSLFIPANSGERISYSLTVFLAFQLYLTFVETDFPSGVNINLKNYLFVQLYFSVAYLVASIISVRISKRKSGKPEKYKMFILFHKSIINKLYCLSLKSVSDVDQQQRTKADDNEATVLSDGSKLSVVVQSDPTNDTADENNNATENKNPGVTKITIKSKECDDDDGSVKRTCESNTEIRPNDVEKEENIANYLKGDHTKTGKTVDCDDVVKTVDCDDCDDVVKTVDCDDVVKTVDCDDVAETLDWDDVANSFDSSVLVVTVFLNFFTHLYIFYIGNM